MNATPDQSRLERIEELGKTLLNAGNSLEKEDWIACEKSAYHAARLARMLMLEEWRIAKEKSENY